MNNNNEANVLQIVEKQKSKLVEEFTIDELALLEQNMTTNGLGKAQGHKTSLNFQDEHRNVLIDENGLHCDASFLIQPERVDYGPKQQVFFYEPIQSIDQVLTLLDEAGVIDATFDLEGE